MATRNANLKKMVDKEDSATPPTNEKASCSIMLEPLLNPTNNCAFVPVAVIALLARFSSFSSSMWNSSLLFSSDSRRISCSGVNFTWTRGEDEEEAVTSEVEGGRRGL